MEEARVSLSAADLVDLARDPSNEVIIEHAQEPWDPVRVGECIRAISSACDCEDKLRLLLGTSEIAEFREAHPRLYELSQSKDERVMSFIKMMLRTKMEVNSGKLSHEDAANIVLCGIRENGGTATSGLAG